LLLALWPLSMSSAPFDLRRAVRGLFFGWLR
jgi:hypothetical protein